MTKWSMLSWSSYHGNEDVVEALLKSNAASYLCSDQNKKDSQYNSSDDRHSSDSPGSGTPLHRAAQRGYLKICWQLLMASFSTEDVDRTGNTSLHLSAANGHNLVLVCLIEGGANVHRKNMFNLTAYDVAKNNVCRLLLKKAMSRATPTSSERDLMHQRQIEKYMSAESRIKRAIGSTNRDIDQLRLLITAGTSAGVATRIIQKAMKYVECLELEQKLTIDIKKVKDNSPIINQTRYNLVDVLRNTLKIIDEQILTRDEFINLEYLKEEGQRALLVSNSEMFLNSLVGHLSPIECATEAIMDEINQLKESFENCACLGGNVDLIENAKQIHARLEGEINVQSALDGLNGHVIFGSEHILFSYEELATDDENKKAVKVVNNLSPPMEIEEYSKYVDEKLGTLQEKLARAESILQVGGDSGGNNALLVNLRKMIDDRIEDKALLEVRKVELAEEEIKRAAKRAKKKKKKGNK
eukprot:CAMPEP_0194373680 /NCGR_PEP_ID=MMETSP0174-20130528/22161_1 /TAXON_ID=216777 /ORGANISM="Proboscia alata, Strain PI-D3" /LENGTH=469 /DNA_ID=CAMNT_0039152919 /DNA_START=239 /DNA_END=1645 /DNA_ORIENTATION=-